MNNFAEKRKIAVDKFFEDKNILQDSFQHHFKPIITIEGVDAVGKNTIARKIHQYAIEDGLSAEMVSFPRYDTLTGTLIRLMLNGSYGINPSDSNISPYLVSSPYTLDRISYFYSRERDNLEFPDILIMDRGPYSNFIHQGSKLRTIDEIVAYINDAYNSEYRNPYVDPTKFGFVYFLYMDEAERLKQLEQRAQNGREKDLNEANTEYLQNCVKFILSTQETILRNELENRLNPINYMKYVANVVLCKCKHGNTEEEIEEYTSDIAQKIYLNFLSPRRYEMITVGTNKCNYLAT